MTLRRRQIMAALLGIALTALMLLLAALGGATRPPVPAEALVRREVQIYVPPPPPPPPPQTQSRPGGGGGQPLALVSGKSDVKLEVMELDVRMPVADAGIGGLGAGGFGSGGFGEGMVIDLGTVDLGDLDGYPAVVSAPLVDFTAFKRDNPTLRMADEFTVRFHIMIDEEGNTTPVRIVENPYPGLNAVLLEFAAKVRFTPPTRQGVRVRTEYLWPVTFDE